MLRGITTVTIDIFTLSSSVFLAILGLEGVLALNEQLFYDTSFVRFISYIWAASFAGMVGILSARVGSWMKSWY